MTVDNRAAGRTITGADARPTASACISAAEDLVQKARDAADSDMTRLSLERALVELRKGSVTREGVCKADAALEAVLHDRREDLDVTDEAVEAAREARQYLLAVLDEWGGDER